MPHPPAATPLPPAFRQRKAPAHLPDGVDKQHDGVKPDEDFSVPALQLHIRHLKHAGATRFLRAINITECMSEAIANVLRLLYNSPSDPDTTPPRTSCVALILEDMPGVAYTVGSGEDGNTKEIHFSLQYIAGINASRLAHEITGVITHELVHCFQHNGLRTAPAGLVEGVADWVRLNCQLGPPHWKQETSHNWDAGYQHTAYFLEYLERRFGRGTVRRINEKLRASKYEEAVYWSELFGHDVSSLYKEYVGSLKS